MRSQERLTTSVDRPVDIFFDASVRRDPESAAIGFVITAPDGRKLATKGKPMNVRGNTQAEYLALLEALQTALTYPGIEHIRVHGDCQSVLDVIDDTAEASPNSADIEALAWKARELLGAFDSAELQYIRRDQNVLADRLAYVGHEQRVTTAPSLPKNRFQLPPSRRHSPAAD
jgi:ribonuclease HI